MTSEIRFKLLRFGAEWCPSCRRMAKAETLEKFAAAHREVEIVKYDLSDGEEPTQAQREAEDIADEYDVESIPALIFVDMEGVELARRDEFATLSQLQGLYTEAKEAYGDL